MSTDKLTEFFKDNRAEFDFEEPRSGHDKRFMEKLRALNSEDENDVAGFNWRPLLMVAASIVLIITLVIGGNTAAEPRDLANVSDEMAQTQDFFTTAITAEIENISAQNQPEYQDLVVDALFQIKLLEEDYQKLRTDLEESGDDKRVIHAMITNFQNRINILQNVSDQIDELKQLKLSENENSSTL